MASTSLGESALNKQIYKVKNETCKGRERLVVSTSVVHLLRRSIASVTSCYNAFILDVVHVLVISKDNTGILDRSRRRIFCLGGKGCCF